MNHIGMGWALLENLSDEFLSGFSLSQFPGFQFIAQHKGPEQPEQSKSGQNDNFAVYLQYDMMGICKKKCNVRNK